MGILAEENMLRLLAFFISVSILTQGLAFADDRSVSFFKVEDQADDCKGCIKEGSILSIGLKKKVEEIEKETSGNFVRQDEGRDNEVSLFIDPESHFSDAAVNTLARFKQDHPNWKCNGVIITGLRSLKEKLLQKRNYFTSDIEFNIDINGEEAREFDITTTPSYVVIYHGRKYKIAGQPDLDEIISRFNK